MAGTKILIVEDEVETMNMLKAILERFFECQIYLSESGEDAISKINRNSFDLVILDIKMQGLSGLDVIKRINKKQDSVDILVVTAWDSNQIANEVIKKGVLDYIPKPIEPDIFKMKIKDILKKKGKYIAKSFEDS